MPSSESTVELQIRIRWTLARIAELMNEGRGNGWLAGAPIPIGVDSSQLLAAARIAAEHTPMTILGRRLALSATELDVLWLLACVELDPAAACAAHQLLIGNTNTITVQLLDRLMAIGGEAVPNTVLRDLTHLVLVETTNDPSLPLFRRPIRVSDRVLALVRGELGVRGVEPRPGGARAIDELFASRGLVIAYPQRDVHLNVLRPVEVRLSPPFSQAKAA